MENEPFGCIVRMKIKTGHEDAFRNELTALLDNVRANEPGTQKYEWYSDADNNVVVREWFANSQAAVPHFTGASAAKHFPALLAHVDDVGIDVTGSPTGVVKDVLDQFGAKYHTRMSGITR